MKHLFDEDREESLDDRAFLFQVMRHYYEEDGDDLYLRQIILPNKRAGIFAQKYLASISGKPMFAPRLRTIEDFIHGLLPDYTILDPIALLFELYNSYVEVLAREGMHYRAFEDFVYWGRIILSDFDLIDKYCIDANQIFRNIADYKELEATLEHLDEETREALAQFFQSSSLSTSRSDGNNNHYREQYLHFWESLGRIYAHFTTSLWSRHLCYEGQIYRYLAEHAGEIADALEQVQEERGEKSIAFVGLFDISPSEMRLFKMLRTRGLAEFCWDEQVYILNATIATPTHAEHPALRIHKANKAALGGVQGLWTEVECRTFLPRRIEKIQCSSTIVQAKILPDLLSRMGFSLSDEEKDLLQVAIILPDESMLLPTVGAIPSDYQRLNVTLGYPLDYTPVAVVINRWRQMILSSKSKGSFAVGAILSFISHQFLTKHLPVLQRLSVVIRRQHSYFLSGSWLIDTYQSLYQQALSEGAIEEADTDRGRLQRDIARLLFSEEMTAEHLLLGVQSLLESILSDFEEANFNRREREQFKEEDDPLVDEAQREEEEIAESFSGLSIFDAEFVHHYLRLINRLRGLLQGYGLEGVSAQTALELLTELGSGIQIPFDGDPLEGLQIMGLLYSRLLHFPKLIYLSSEDANLSRSSVDSSLIPYVLRIGFGLPRGEEQDAVLAYRFYQSIAHADELYMVYTNDEEGAEESRYLLQLEYLYGVPVKKHRVEIFPNLADAYSAPRELMPPIVVAKEGWVRGELDKYLASPTQNSGEYRSLSPTSLIDYIKCPLYFYYKHIVGLREEDEPEELMADNKLGDIFHKVMERIYQPYERGVEVVPGQRLLQIARSHSQGGRLCLIDRLVREAYLEIYMGLRAEDAERQTDNEARFAGVGAIYCEQIASYVRATLELDGHIQGELRYYYGELKAQVRYPLCAGKWVNIKGSIDRVDQVRGESGEAMLRVLDYKTGADDISGTVSIPDLFEAGKKMRKSKVRLQTLLYCELILLGEDERSGTLKKTLSLGGRMTPGAYITQLIGWQRERYVPFYKLELLGGKSLGGDDQPMDYQEVREEFLSHLSVCLSELFDYERPFVQTAEASSCTYCSFKSSCNRL